MSEMNSPEELWDQLASEFLHLYPSGGRLIGVAGADADQSSTAADGLAQALERRGQVVQRWHSADGDETSLREGPIAQLRLDRNAERVLVVSGPGALLSPSARGLWNFSVWQFGAGEQPHTAASALVDLSDPGRPQRRFADYCALPPSYGS